MCNFVSLIITKSGKIYGDGSFDSHQDLLNQNKDKNEELIEKSNPEYSEEENIKAITFALIEVLPKDNDIFNLKSSNWEVKIDQPRKPAWWDSRHEKKCLTEAKKILKKQVIVGGEYETLDRDVRFIKDAKIKILRSKVGEMRGSSQVGKMQDSSQVGKMWGSSQVGEMWGSSQVGEMWGSSQVGKMQGSSQVGKMWDSSQVGKMWDSSQVGKMQDSSQVGKMQDSSQVGKMWDSSQVILASSDNTINIWSKDAVIKELKNGRCVVIKRYLKDVKVEIK